MKNFTCLLVLFISLSLSTIHAQKLTVNGFSTYQMKLGGTIRSDAYYTSDSASATAVNENIGAGFGAGLTVEGLIKGNLFWETRFYFIMGYSSYKVITDVSGFLSTDYHDLNMFSIRIEPAIRLNFGEKKLKFSLSVGPAISLFNTMTKSQKTDVSMSFFTYNVSDVDTRYTGGLGMGGSGVFGMHYDLGSRFVVYSDFNVNSLFWAPQKSVITHYTSNGTDALPNMTTSQKEAVYVDEYSVGSSQDENQPSKALKVNYTMSTYGIRIGVKFHIIKIEKPEPALTE